MSKIDDLQELFVQWRGAQIEEVKVIKNKLGEEKDKKENEGLKEAEIFERLLYKNRIKDYNNTVSSHFVQFFHKKKNMCEECMKDGIKKLKDKNVWEYVLENAFNMDGNVGKFKVQEGGYKYICLLKEANDSGKVCTKDYDVNMEKQENVNNWLVQWRAKETKAPMLEKLNGAFYRLTHNGEELKESDDYCFTEDVAYMNVNKRGGTVQTAGFDETALINYAKKYKEFILCEVEILSSKEETVVFVAGNRKYYERLMNALELKKSPCKNEYYHGKITFVNITHPSGRISVEKLAEQMRKGK